MLYSSSVNREMRLLRRRYDILKILFVFLVQRHSHQLTARAKIDLVEIDPGAFILRMSSSASDDGRPTCEF